MGRKLNINVSDWWLVAVGGGVVVLSGTTLFGIMDTANKMPLLSPYTLLGIGIAREVVGYLYQVLKNKELPNDK